MHVQVKGTIAYAQLQSHNKKLSMHSRALIASYSLPVVAVEPLTKDTFLSVPKCLHVFVYLLSGHHLL